MLTGTTKILFGILINVGICIGLWLLTKAVFNPVADSQMLPYEPNYSSFMALVSVPLALSISLLSHPLFGYTFSGTKHREYSYLAAIVLFVAFLWGFCVSFFIMDTVNIDFPGGLWPFVWYGGSDILADGLPVKFYLFIVFFLSSFAQMLFLRKTIKPTTFSKGKLIMGIVLLPVLLVTIQFSLWLIVTIPYRLLPEEKETFLVPDDYIGCFRVLYGDENGLVPDVVDGRALIPIPKDGIVRLKREFEPKGFTLSTYHIWSKTIDHGFARVKQANTSAISKTAKMSNTSPVRYDGYEFFITKKGEEKRYYKKFRVNENEVDGIRNYNDWSDTSFAFRCKQLDETIQGR